MAKKTKNHPCWLFKEEPDHYNYSDLVQDGRTVWDGVTNNQARLHLRNVAKGDRVLYYHTGKEKAIVGEMKVVSAPYCDDDDDPKSVVVDVMPVQKWKVPITLAEIKEDGSLAEWDLVRNSRLSIVPINEEQWQKIEKIRKDKVA